MNAEDFLLFLSESKECKDVEYRSFAITEWMGFHIDWDNPEKRLESPFIPFKDVIKSRLKNGDVDIDELVKYMIQTDKSNFVLFALSARFKRKENMSELDYFTAISREQILTPFVDEINMDDFSFVVEAYILDNLVSKRRNLLDITIGEIFEYKTNSYNLSWINGAEFKRDGLIYDGKGYLYNPFTNKELINPLDQIPGFAKIINEECMPCDILYRLDEQLAVPSDEYEDYTGVAFARFRGPMFDFAGSELTRGKNIIVHIDDETNDKLLMVVKTDNKENDEEFWHVEIETIPYPKSECSYLTTFLHGMYFPKRKEFVHIDFTKNEYKYDTYRKKYEDSQTGMSIDTYTESKKQHYKIWCVENGHFSEKTWYKLMVVSLSKRYQKLFNDMLKNPEDIIE